jgi:hypothetical protein
MLGRPPSPRPSPPGEGESFAGCQSFEGEWWAGGFIGERPKRGEYNRDGQMIQDRALALPLPKGEGERGPKCSMGVQHAAALEPRA